MLRQRVNARLHLRFNRKVLERQIEGILKYAVQVAVVFEEDVCTARHIDARRVRVIVSRSARHNPCERDRIKENNLILRDRRSFCERFFKLC